MSTVNGCPKSGRLVSGLNLRSNGIWAEPVARTTGPSSATIAVTKYGPMSNMGPTPTLWYRSTCTPMAMIPCADRGLPTQPSSISLRQVCKPAPRNVSGAPPISSPLVLAVSISVLPSSRVTASGFSVYTFLPAASAAMLTS